MANKHTLIIKDERWHRTTWVTKGTDPTEVVEWKHGDITITQFQNVIVANDGAPKDIDYEAAYSELERLYDIEAGEPNDAEVGLSYAEDY